MKKSEHEFIVAKLHKKIEELEEHNKELLKAIDSLNVDDIPDIMINAKSAVQKIRKAKIFILQHNYTLDKATAIYLMDKLESEFINKI